MKTLFAPVGIVAGLVAGFAAKKAFEKVDDIQNDGLGPVFNAQSCSACHQNPVTGAISQITELRAGHNRQIVVSGALVTIFVDAAGGSLIRSA